MQILLSVIRWFVRFFRKLNGSADTTYGNGYSYHTHHYGSRAKKRDDRKTGNYFRQAGSAQKSRDK